MTRSPELFLRRRNQVRKSLRARRFDAVVVQAERNVTWLTGFSGDSTWLVVTQDAEILISDFRYITQLK